MKNYFSLWLLLLSSFCNAQSNNTLLWKISGKDLTKPSYIFGTIHIPQKQFVEFSDSVYTAIQSCDHFYGEINFVNGVVSELSNPEALSFFKEKGEYLDSASKTAGWRKMIERINKQFNKNIDLSNLQEFILFSQEMLAEMYKKDEGVEVPDLMLMTWALSQKKHIGGLETLLFQMAMLYNIIEVRLADSTMGFSDEVLLTQSLKRFYKAQQLDSISIILETVHPSYKKIIFDNRNASMVDSMILKLKSGASFFAVGCGHLPGKKGIIELMRSNGYKVEPVFSSSFTSILDKKEKIIPPPIEKGDATKDEEGEIIHIGRIDQAQPVQPPKTDPPGVKIKRVKKEKSNTD
jgi:uncharacterized protein